jgi:hypothetical protein
MRYCGRRRGRDIKTELITRKYSKRAFRADREAKK